MIDMIIEPFYNTDKPEFEYKHRIEGIVRNYPSTYIFYGVSGRERVYFVDMDDGTRQMIEVDRCKC